MNCLLSVFFLASFQLKPIFFQQWWKISRITAPLSQYFNFYYNKKVAINSQLKSSLCVELHKFLAERREVRKLYISYEMLKYELLCWDSCSKAQKSPFNLLHCIFFSFSFYLSLSTRIFDFFFFLSNVDHPAL